MSAQGKGLLSMVGTPIGNLGDASPRVIDALQTAQVVLCEDTRVTAKLLNHFDLRVPLLRCDENVIAQRVEGVLNRLLAGEHVAFVSDAGMPGVSDPGQRLVDAALDAGLRVEVIPGPSAVICALVASGLPMDHFFFEGFLPRKAGPRSPPRGRKIRASRRLRRSLPSPPERIVPLRSGLNRRGRGCLPSAAHYQGRPPSIPEFRRIRPRRPCPGFPTGSRWRRTHPSRPSCSRSRPT